MNNNWTFYLIIELMSYIVLGPD